MASGRIITSRDVVFDENTPMDDLTKQGEATPYEQNEHGLPVEPMPEESLRELQDKRTPLNPDTDVEMTDVSNSANPSQDIPSPIHPLQDDVIDLGTSLFGRKRQPSRRLLESAAAAFLMNIIDLNSDPQSY